jgi:hypothetical protein
LRDIHCIGAIAPSCRRRQQLALRLFELESN